MLMVIAVQVTLFGARVNHAGGDACTVLRMESACSPFFLAANISFRQKHLETLAQQPDVPSTPVPLVLS